VALLTTLYGLLLSNLVFLPLSKKVASAAEDETTAFTLILEGVMDIADGRNSKAVAHRLRSYLAMKKATSENGRPALRPTKAASGPLAERRENA
jgi:chemotaxis protein MotA